MNNENLTKAQALHRSGRLAEAENAYGALLAESDNPDARHGLALLLNQTGRSAEAIPILEQLLAIDSDSVSSRLVLARCLAATGDLQAAIEQCNIACEMLPDNPAAWSLAGQLKQQACDPRAALDSLERALGIDPTHGPALHNQGIALATLGQHDAALLAYEGALKVMPLAARVY
ncbi:MAG: tetratricopeptide repeat protein, partial [Gammaproteobacteria bacterium]|nr:tetratricopeptide repeat protein [Gammaproteobacteria bacterium]